MDFLRPGNILLYTYEKDYYAVLTLIYLTIRTFDTNKRPS